MFNWLFKKVVKIREKVAVDLGDKDEEKPFLDHLEDLRTMIVRVVITLLVTVLVSVIFYKPLIGVLMKPIEIAGLTEHIQMVGIKPMDYFMAAIRVTVVAGIIASFPLLMYFVLQFILPGMKANEKKVLFPAIGVGAGLFLLGAVFSYFFVVPRALRFFYDFSVEVSTYISGVPVTESPMMPWNITETIKFISQFILIFGACFELPVVVLALVKLDILNYKLMKGTRSWAAIIIAVVAALITPTPDAFTLALLAVPMYLLYEICIWLAWGMERRDRKLYPEYYKERDEDDKDLEVAEDWDNENYNPWGGDDQPDEDDDDLDGGGSKPKPKPSPSSPDPSSAAVAPSPEPTPSPNSPANTVPMNDDFYNQPSPETLPETNTPPADPSNEDDDPQSDVEKRNLD